MLGGRGGTKKLPWRYLHVEETQIQATIRGGSD
jgi:hypothetical protein